LARDRITREFAYDNLDGIINNIQHAETVTFANDIRTGGSSGGSGGKLNKPEIVVVGGKEELRQWDPKRNIYVPFTQQGVTKPAKASGYTPKTPAPAGGRSY